MIYTHTVRMCHFMFYELAVAHTHTQTCIDRVSKLQIQRFSCTLLESGEWEGNLTFYCVLNIYSMKHGYILTFDVIALHTCLHIVASFHCFIFSYYWFFKEYNCDEIFYKIINFNFSVNFTFLILQVVAYEVYFIKWSKKVYKKYYSYLGTFENCISPQKV